MKQDFYWDKNYHKLQQIINYKRWLLGIKIDNKNFMKEIYIYQKKHLAKWRKKWLTTYGQNNFDINLIFPL